MKKTKFVFVIFIIIIGSVFAQENTSKYKSMNGVSLQLLGSSAGEYSINYERRFKLKNDSLPRFSVKIGIGYYNFGGSSPIDYYVFYLMKENNYLSIPLAFNYIIPRKGGKKFIEFGGGLTYLDVGRQRRLVATANFDLRYQKKSGLYYKIGLSLLYNFYVGGNSYYLLPPIPLSSILLYPSFSIGYSF